MKSGKDRLSKSQYVKGRKCLRRVWLYNNRRELMTPPSTFQAGIFEQGHEVGRLAQNLFPGGALVTEDHRDPDGAIATTEAHINNGAPAIYEAAFVFNDILIRADAVVRNGNGKWHLYEVKSSTSVKRDHLFDAAIQKYVLEGYGLPLDQTHIVHLNNRYVRGGNIDLQQLFVIQPVDDRLDEASAEIPNFLSSIRGVLGQDEEPMEPIGSVCKNPYECEFKKYCWKDVEADSIHYLSRISDTKRADLLGRKITRIKDVPEDFELTALQAIQAQVERDGNHKIDRNEIQRFLAGLRYPLWFLDFETYGFAIPEYNGTRSYEALPFQFSLHVQDKPGGPVTHFEFLHPDRSDPRKFIATELSARIGAVGSVVTYHGSFERSRIETLAEMFPNLRTSLESIASRIFDLETPFAKKWYCDSRFQGSSSIKKVLPVLVPEMTYEDMEIGKGDDAQAQYCEMIKLDLSDPRKEKIRQALLSYCKQDTLAMVRILEVLHSLK